jgi:hypothetical protein
MPPGSLAVIKAYLHYGSDPPNHTAEGMKYIETLPEETTWLIFASEDVGCKSYIRRGVNVRPLPFPGTLIIARCSEEMACSDDRVVRVFHALIFKSRLTWTPKSPSVYFHQAIRKTDAMYLKF